jgi:hypothetical protein
MMQVNYEKELSALAAEIINEEGATKEQAYICAAGLLDALLAYAREWDKSCVPDDKGQSWGRPRAGNARRLRRLEHREWQYREFLAKQ